MTDTTFISRVTQITTAWLQDVNDLIYRKGGSKTTPVDADEVSLWDSVSGTWKRLTWANLKATLKAYFDTLYATLGANSNITSMTGLTTPTVLANPVRVTDLQANTLGAYTTGGSSTAYTLTTLTTGLALTTNERWTVAFHTSPGATPTLNRDSKGAVALKVYDGYGAKRALTSSDIASVATNTKADIVYDGTDYVVLTTANRIPRSEVRVTTTNGYGSTNTKYRRFTTEAINTGSDITYADSATDGASFTINTAGNYAITYVENFNTAGRYGIVLNDSTGTTNIASTAVGPILCIAVTNGVDVEDSISTTVYLAAGDVIRAKTDAYATGTGKSLFSMVKV